MTPSPTNPGALNWALALFLGLIWGSAFLFTAEALDGYGPWTVAAGRTTLGGLTLLAVALVLGQGPDKVPNRRGWVAILAIGTVSTAAPFALLSLGLQVVPSAFAGVAMGSVPLLVLPLVAIFSPEEGIGPRRVFGTLLGFAGLVLLIGPKAWSGDPAHWGMLACVGAACGYAIGSVTTRRAPAMPPLTLAALSLCVAGVPLIPAALIIEGLPQISVEWPLAALFVLALGPTALAAVLRVRVITTAGSLFMSLVSYLVPIWAVILGGAVRGERLPSLVFVALALILCGIAIAQSRSLLAAFNTRKRD